MASLSYKVMFQKKYKKKMKKHISKPAWEKKSKEKGTRPGEMAQWVKMLAAKTDNSNP